MTDRTAEQRNLTDTLDRLNQRLPERYLYDAPNACVLVEAHGDERAVVELEWGDMVAGVVDGDHVELLGNLRRLGWTLEARR